MVRNRNRQANYCPWHQRDHIAAVRSSLSAEQLADFERQAVRSADEDQQQALNNPVFRDMQLQLLVDDLLRKRFPNLSQTGGCTEADTPNEGREASVTT